jgi:hypothetical protein
VAQLSLIVGAIPAIVVDVGKKKVVDVQVLVIVIDVGQVVEV